MTKGGVSPLNNVFFSSQAIGMATTTTSCFRAVAVEADRPDAYRVNRYRPRSGARRAARDLSDLFMSGLKIDSPGRSTRIASMVSKWSSVVSDSRGPWQ